MIIIRNSKYAEALARGM